MGYIKKLKNNELVGGTDKTTIYPVTSTEAVFEEVSDNEFKSQKYLNNHITNERIVDNTIENDKLKDDTVDMGKLNTQLKTIIQNAYDASWKVKEEPFSLETKYDANDVVYDPDTNSSYVSLTADNRGNPVRLEDEEEVNPYWRLVINGISAIESTEVIDAKVTELQDQVDNKIDDAQHQLDQMIADAADSLADAEQNAINATNAANAKVDWVEEQVGSLTAYEVATTLDTESIIPVQNKVVTTEINKIEDYLNTGVTQLSLGTTYNKGDSVVTTDNELLVIKKEIGTINLTDTVISNSLKISGNKTYKALKTVKEYASYRNYNDDDYAVGSPAKVSLNISKDIHAGNMIVSIGNDISQTITVEITDTTATIADKIVNALFSIEDTGWTFETIDDDKIQATSIEFGDYSSTSFTLINDSDSIVTGFSGESSVSTIGDDSTSTVLILTLKIGVGSINVSLGNSETGDIEITSEDTPVTIAGKIVSAGISGWNLVDISEGTSGSVTAECLTGGNQSSIDFSITDTFSGVTCIKNDLFLGSDALSVYDSETGWNVTSLEGYTSSNVWSEVETVDALKELVTEPNSLTKDFSKLAQEIKEDEFVVTKYATKTDKKLEELDDKVSKQELYDDEYVITKAIAELSESSGGSSSGDSGMLSIGNSDIISVIGSSFTDGGHVAAGKNWVHRISEVSDYQYHNDGIAGLDYVGALSGNYTCNSIRYKGYCLGKYVILNDNENIGVQKLNGVTYTTWWKSVDNIIRVCMGLGVEPIFATNWPQKDNLQGISQMYEDYAREHNLIYMNGNNYTKTLLNVTNYGPFNSGTHLGTRCQGIFSDAYIPYLKRMEKPTKSMKIFRLRASYNTFDLDQLMFTDNEDRLRYFRELWVGHSMCSANTVDNSPDFKNYGSLPDEYATLKDGGSISFTNAALISAVLPYTGKNITSLKLSFFTNSEVSVYVKDSLAKPYPSVTYYTRFNVMDEITVPATGDTYSDGTTTFTVSTIILGENGSYCTIYMEGWTDGDAEGTLTRVSGSGSDTISYNMREQTSESAVASDTCGHWRLVPKTATMYDFTEIASRIMDLDKLHVLIVGESFTISEPRIYYSGDQYKFTHREKYSFVGNVDNPNSELIPESTFGAVGKVQTYWKDDNGDAITSTANYEILNPDTQHNNGLPQGTSSIIRVDDTHSMITTVSSAPPSGRLMLEIYARYFAPVYTDGSGNQITVESYDYEDLYVQIGNRSYTNGSTIVKDAFAITIKKVVGLMWQIIQIPLTERGDLASCLRLYGGPKGIEIAKVSLKKMQNYEVY